VTLRNATLSVRVFATSILFTLGIGFVLSLVYLYTQKVHPHKLQGHGVVEGIAYTYHGIPSEPRLIASLQGSMASTINDADFEIFKAWTDAGGTEEAYAGTVESLVQAKCTSCHDEGGYFPRLETYEDIAPLASPDSGVDVKRLAQTTHVHLLGMPLLFYILGALFVRTRHPEKVKAILVAVPFVAIVWDIAHWWITKLNPEGAAGIVFGGALMSLGFALQWFLTFYDVWWKAPKAEVHSIWGE